MKRLGKIVMLTACLGFMLNLSSCVVYVKKDNGKHKGWYKNPNNPHNPQTTNPGKAKGKK